MAEPVRMEYVAKTEMVNREIQFTLAHNSEKMLNLQGHNLLKP